MGLPVVATYFWQPDPGSKFAHAYTPDDVRLLQRMVARHLTVPHQFAVITDHPDAFAEDDIRAIPIDRATHVPGTCFVRLMTFHPQGKEMIGDKVLQLDLDTIIVGNIDHLLAREEDDLVLWRNPTINPKRPGRSFYNTSILLHRCGSIPEVWETFIGMGAGARRTVKDDQWFLSDVFGPHMPYFDGARDGVYRLARADTPGSGVDGDLPKNACVVTFPGSEGKPSDPAIVARNPWIVGHRR